MTASPSGRTTADTVFFRSLVITTIIRAILAAIVPLTGDEAYFVVWGEHLDYGYYDHTPMAGWWLAAVLALGKTVWLVRLPALLTTIAVACLIWRAAARIDGDKAGWVGALYLWSPHNVLNFFTTTDTPLLLFSVLAGLWLFRAVRRDRPADYLLAGLALGLAFLSKYFAVLLGVAMAVMLLALAGRPRWFGLFLVFLGVVPSAAVNIAWNYHHGWTNILFNLFNRTNDAGFSLGNVLAYFAVITLPVAPIAWSLLRPRADGRRAWRAVWDQWTSSGALTYAACFVVPLALLFLVSLQKSVGLHWPLAFFPFLFIALVQVFSAEALRRMVRAMAVFGGTLAGVGAVAVLLPVELLHKHKSYDSVVLSMHADEVLAALAPYQADYTLATPSYAKSALLSFLGTAYVPVIGPGSYHGRQDDFITDFRAYDGKNLMVLCDTEARAAAARAWFDDAEVRALPVRGASFRLVLGRGFRFGEYRDAVLHPIALRYYSMPAWLSAWAEPSFFFVRYGFPRDEIVRHNGGS